MLQALGYTILSAYLSVQPQALKLQDALLKNRETKHFISLLLNDEVLLLQCYSAEVESFRTWSRGHILKSLASKVKPLASKPQVLKKCLPSVRGQQYFLNC